MVASSWLVCCRSRYSMVCICEERHHGSIAIRLTVSAPRITAGLSLRGAVRRAGARRVGARRESFLATAWPCRTDGVAFAAGFASVPGTWAAADAAARRTAVSAVTVMIEERMIPMASLFVI